jgi:hypothetical protein
MNARLLSLLAGAVLSALSLTILAGCSSAAKSEGDGQAAALEQDASSPQTSLLSDPDLRFLMEGLRSVPTDAGFSLRKFEYRDNPVVPTDAQEPCRLLTARRLESDFENLVLSILGEGDSDQAPQLTPEKIDAAQAAFGRFMRQGSHLLCRSHTDTSMTTYYIGDVVRASFERTF